MTDDEHARSERLTVEAVIARIQAVLDDAGSDQPMRDILEAGCGSDSHFRLDPEARITGIDVSPEQLENNERLDEAILADIQTHPLKDDAFDLVVCWYVLEHVPRPRQALANMARALRPGGLLVIAIPSVTSFKGLVTKFTPHWFHVFVYRRLLGRKDAGKPGNPPFPTYLRWAMRPAGIRGFAAERGMDVRVLDMFEDYTQVRILKRVPLLRFFYKGANAVLQWVGGRNDCMYLSDFAFVLQKPRAP